MAVPTVPFKPGCLFSGKTEEWLLSERSKLADESANNGRALAGFSVNGSSSSFVFNSPKSISDRLLQIDYALSLLDPNKYESPTRTDRSAAR